MTRRMRRKRKFVKVFSIYTLAHHQTRCVLVCVAVFIVCVCVAGLAKLKGFVAARRGERDDMQDAHVILPNLHTHADTLPTHV